MAGQWQPVAMKAGIDAYVDWLRGPGGKYPPKYEEKSALVCLAPGTTLKDFRGRCADIKRLEPQFDIPFLSGDEELEHFTLSAKDDFLDALQQHKPLRECINRIIVAQKLPDDAICGGAADDASFDAHAIASGADQASSRGPEPGTVVIGVIEEGVALANQRFRRSAGESRVEYAWIQDARCVDYVQGFGYGRELSKEDRKGPNGKVVQKGIDTLLGECTNGGQLNEDLFYSKAGLADFGRPGHKAVAQRASHGALVMDLACGYDQGTSPVGSNGLDQRPIVCVQLPTITVADTSGLGLERYMLDGLNYILQRAHRIAQSRGCGPLPVVINFSSGILAGPHDGTHPIELAIDQIIDRRRKIAPTEVVLPTGNSYLARIHAKSSIPAKRGNKNGEATLQWRALPDDKTCTYLEIWLPHSNQDEAGGIGLELVIVPPGGEPSPPLADAKSKRAIVWRPNGRDELCKVYYEHFGPPTNRGRYLVALVPTAFDNAPSQLAPCGTWTIQLRNTTRKTIGDVEAWIQWDDRPLGYPRSGRQSYFTDDAYQRFDRISGREVETDNAKSVVQRAGTISAIATGSRTVVVGGFRHKEMKVTSYSGAGPIARTGGSTGAVNRAGPDALAVSDDSSVHQGILSAGTRSRSMVTPNGTSVAAPQITREIAEWLARGDRRSGREIVKALAIDQESHRPQSPSRPTKERGGWGRIVLPRGTSRVGRLRIAET